VDTINGDNLLHLAVRYRDLHYFIGKVSSIGIPNFTERNWQNMTPIELAESLGKYDVAKYLKSILQQKESELLWNGLLNHGERTKDKSLMKMK